MLCSLDLHGSILPVLGAITSTSLVDCTSTLDLWCIDTFLFSQTIHSYSPSLSQSIFQAPDWMSSKLSTTQVTMITQCHSQYLYLWPTSPFYSKTAGPRNVEHNKKGNSVHGIIAFNKTLFFPLHMIPKKCGLSSPECYGAKQIAYSSCGTAHHERNALMESRT